MVLVDTSIIIDYIKKEEEAVLFLEGLDQIIVSAVTVAEVYQGARNKTELKYLEEALLAFAVLPLTEPITATSLELLKEFTLSHRLTILDSLIAATALEHNFKLATLNTKHFQMIEGLKVVKPY